MSKISEETIKEVLKANDIVETIGSYIPLTQKGKNFFCVCPFHDDHSPSMSISRDKQIFKCFVCGTSGNVISFIKEYLKVDFLEAVEILAKNAGMNLNIEKKEEKGNPNKELYDIYRIANSFYRNNLNSKEGSEARKYLEERHLDKETIDYFDIGLAVNDGLTKNLSKKYLLSTLKTIGLTNNSGYDLFKNRIMFSIKDNEGNIVGFSGRKYAESDEAKYVNTMETPIFKKGKILYNYYNAKEYIRKSHEIIISEGQMEIIRMHTIGVNDAVALMGTAFTKDQLELIKKLKCDVVLNLDQDEAGKKATITIGDELVKNDINPTVILFSGYKDTDELIIGEGKEAFEKAYKGRVNFIDFKLNYLKQNKDLKDSKGLSDYIKEAIDAINLIDDDILREIKIQSLSTEYNISVDLIKSKITNTSIKKEEKKEYKEIKSIKYDKYDKSEIRILFLMMYHSNLITYFENNLGYLNNDKRKKLALEIINYYNINKTFDIADFICYTSEREDLNVVMNEVLGFNQSEDYTMEEIEDYFLRVKEYSVKKRIDDLSFRLKNTLDLEEKKKLAARIERMKKEVLKW